MAPANTRIGDVFAVRLDDIGKKYFQYVANDSTQLNSDVIRAFEKQYQIDEEPNLTTVVNDNVQFYAHCVTKWGIKMGLWEKVGNISDIGSQEILFRCTNDYGRRPDEAPVRTSDKWYVWKINEDQRDVGRLDPETRRAFIGLIINPQGILELLKGNKYPPLYPD